MPKALEHETPTQERAYTPPEGTAVCPRCGTPAPAIAPTPALYMMMLCYRCPDCGRPWNELRAVDKRPERYWD